MFTIYVITNNANGKRYVGYTSQSVTKRLKQHFYNARRGTDTLLYNSIRKYGEEVFTIETIYESWSKDHALTEAEAHFIVELGTHYTTGGYNMSFGGELSGQYERTEEHRRASALRLEEIRNRPDVQAKYKAKRLSDEQKKAISKRFKEMPRTDEHCHKISGSLKGKPKSEAHREKMKQRNLIPWLVTLPDGSQVVIKDRKVFCAEHDLDYDCFNSASRRGKPHKGYTCVKI